jgi:hypothetical protein
LPAHVEVEESAQVGACHAQEAEGLERGHFGLACPREELVVVL